MDTSPARPHVRIFLSDTHNPWFNLATEEWLFDELDENTQALFLWRNQNTVVIGRNQNPWSECNLAKMDQDGVVLARRTSGGGAVFHDLGNTCFTFLSPRKGYDRSQNTKILLAALALLGVNAEVSGRNDLVIPAKECNGLDDMPRKISGSAFRETQKRAFHHGTFLIQTDLDRLAQYLTPHPKKLQSKGRASVRSRVMNLGDLEVKGAPRVTHERLVGALIEAFLEFHSVQAPQEHLDHSTLEKIPQLQAIFKKFSSWDWRFGHAPQFEQKMVEYLNCGLYEIHFDSEQGLISNARIFSDSLHQELIPRLEHGLVGKKFSRAGLETAFAALRAEFPERREDLNEVQEWLNREVEV